MATAHSLFLACSAAALAGWVVALGGLASMQAQCGGHPEWAAVLLRTAYNQGVGSAGLLGSGDLPTCSAWLRNRWFALAYQLVAIALPLCAYKFAHFKQLKAAAWALLASANMFASYTVDGLLRLALSPTASGALTSAAAAACAGFAVAVGFSFFTIFAGSAADAAAGRAALGGFGAESMLRRVATGFGRSASGVFSSLPAARGAFAGALGLAAAGWAVVLGGVAAMTSYCLGDDDGMAEIRLPWYAYSPMATGVDCGRAFQNLWWAWAFMTAALALVAGLAAAPARLARFKAAIWATAVASTTWNFIYTSQMIDYVADSSGTFRAGAQAALAGFIMYDIGALVVLFAGSAYVYAAQQAGLASAKRPAGGAAPSRAALGAFVGLQALAWAAWIVCIAGVGLYQSEYADTPAAPWGTPAPAARYWWYAVVLQPVTLALVAASWSAPAFKKCKGASWLVLVYSAYVNMQVLAWMSTTLGSGALADSLSTRVRVAYWGFILFDVFAFLMLFAGSAAAWEARRGAGAAAAEASAADEGEDGVDDDGEAEAKAAEAKAVEA